MLNDTDAPSYMQDYLKILNFVKKFFHLWPSSGINILVRKMLCSYGVISCVVPSMSWCIRPVLAVLGTGTGVA
jgi:hypothetical protein